MLFEPLYLTPILRVNLISKYTSLTWMSILLLHSFPKETRWKQFQEDHYLALFFNVAGNSWAAYVSALAASSEIHVLLILARFLNLSLLAVKVSIMTAFLSWICYTIPLISSITIIWPKDKFPYVWSPTQTEAFPFLQSNNFWNTLLLLMTRWFQIFYFIIFKIVDVASLMKVSISAWCFTFKPIFFVISLSPSVIVDMMHFALTLAVKY